MPATYNEAGELIRKKRATVAGIRAKLATEKRKKEVALAELKATKDLIAAGWKPRD